MIIIWDTLLMLFTLTSLIMAAYDDNTGWHGDTDVSDPLEKA